MDICGHHAGWDLCPPTAFQAELETICSPTRKKRETPPRTGPDPAIRRPAKGSLHSSMAALHWFSVGPEPPQPPSATRPSQASCAVQHTAVTGSCASLKKRGRGGGVGREGVGVRLSTANLSSMESRQLRGDGWSTCSEKHSLPAPGLGPRKKRGHPRRFLWR